MHHKFLLQQPAAAVLQVTLTGAAGAAAATATVLCHFSRDAIIFHAL